MSTDQGESTAGDVTERLKRFAAGFDRRFEAYLTPSEDAPAELVEAIRYSALAPGKRLRPYLVWRCCELVGGRGEDAWPAAAAVECVHAFSLIHDDLPAMDDDDLRRGRPTCHKRFGEAVAILAGDGLLALAFEVLTTEVSDPGLATRLAAELARGTGWGGMIGGQCADITGESQPPDLGLAEYIHERKTARLFATSCRLGAMVGGADEASLSALGAFGRSLGRLFQIADDLLDVTSTAGATGKRVAKDQGAGKQSFPNCIGVERSRAAAVEHQRTAVAKLAAFGPPAADLRALTDYVASRNY